MRTNDELQQYVDEGCDEELSAMIERLIGGDNSVRGAVEETCDTIEEDLKKYKE